MGLYQRYKKTTALTLLLLIVFVVVYTSFFSPVYARDVSIPFGGETVRQYDGKNYYYLPTATLTELTVQMGVEEVDYWEVTVNGETARNAGTLNGQTLTLPQVAGLPRAVANYENTDPGHYIWRNSAGTTWQTQGEKTEKYFFTGGCFENGVSECPGQFPAELPDDLENDGSAVTTAYKVTSPVEFFFDPDDRSGNAPRVFRSSVLAASIEIVRDKTLTLSRNVGLLATGKGDAEGYGMVRVSKMLDLLHGADGANNVKWEDYTPIEANGLIGHAQGRNYAMEVNAYWQGITYEYSGSVKVHYKTPVTDKPDLVATSIDFTSPPAVGKPAQLRFVFTNTGASVPVEVCFQVTVQSKKTSDTAYNQLLYNKTFCGMPQGQTVTDDTPYTFPDEKPRTFLLTVDDPNRIAEANEANNKAEMAKTPTIGITGKFKLNPPAITYREPFTLTPQDFDIPAGCTYNAHQYRIIRPGGIVWVGPKVYGQSVVTTHAYPEYKSIVLLGQNLIAIRLFTTCQDTDWLDEKPLEVLPPAGLNGPPVFSIGWFQAGNLYGNRPDAAEVVIGSKVNLRVIHDATTAPPTPYDPDGDPITYTWRFSDSSSAWIQSLASKYFDHDEGFAGITASEMGSHTITAVGDDGLGGVAYATAQLNVVAPNPVAVCTGPGSIKENQPVDSSWFKWNQSYSPSGKRIVEGHFSGIQSVYHTGGADRSMSVTLDWVKDESGLVSLQSSACSFQVIGDKPPVAVIQVNEKSLRATPEQVRSASYSADSDTLVSQAWWQRYDAGNNGFADDSWTALPHTGTSFVFNANEVGKYEFRLKVCEEYGQCAETTKAIDIENQAPHVQFSITGQSNIPGTDSGTYIPGADMLSGFHYINAYSKWNLWTAQGDGSITSGDDRANWFMANARQVDKGLFVGMAQGYHTRIDYGFGTLTSFPNMNTGSTSYFLKDAYGNLLGAPQDTPMPVFANSHSAYLVSYDRISRLDKIKLRDANPNPWSWQVSYNWMNPQSERFIAVNEDYMYLSTPGKCAKMTEFIIPDESEDGWHSEYRCTEHLDYNIRVLDARTGAVVTTYDAGDAVTESAFPVTNGQNVLMVSTSGTRVKTVTLTPSGPQNLRTIDVSFPEAPCGIGDKFTPVRNLSGVFIPASCSFVYHGGPYDKPIETHLYMVHIRIDGTFGFVRQLPGVTTFYAISDFSCSMGGNCNREMYMAGMLSDYTWEHVQVKAYYSAKGGYISGDGYSIPHYFNVYPDGTVTETSSAAPSSDYQYPLRADGYNNYLAYGVYVAGNQESIMLGEGLRISRGSYLIYGDASGPHYAYAYKIEADASKDPTLNTYPRRSQGAFVSTASFGDGEYEMKIRSERFSSGGTVGFRFKATDPYNYYQADMGAGGLTIKRQYRVWVPDSGWCNDENSNGECISWQYPAHWEDRTTQLGAGTYSLGDGLDYTVRLQIAGNRLQAWVNGVAAADVTHNDLTITAGGGMGVAVNAAFTTLYYLKQKVHIADDASFKTDAIAMIGEDGLAHFEYEDGGVMYTDPENDPRGDGFFWRIGHERIFLNDGGLSAWNGYAGYGQVNALDKPGRYRMQVSTWDLPRDRPGFESYRKPSNQALVQLIVHRRPVARFTLTQDSGGKIGWNDTSYDPDRCEASLACQAGYEGDHGIRDWRFFYITPSGQVVYEKLLYPAETGTYTAGMQVRDEHFGWSYWTEQFISVNAVTAPNTPPSVGLTYPAGSQSHPTPLATLRPTLTWSQWDPDPGTVFELYDLEVTDENGTRITGRYSIPQATTAEQGSWTMDTSLTPGRKYAVRVRVSDGRTWSAWSHTGWMQTNRPPEAAMRYPDGTEAAPTLSATRKPVLRWTQTDPDANARFDYFQIQVTNEGNDTMVLDSGKQWQGSYAGEGNWEVGQELPAGVKLRVRVKVWDEHGAESDWSPQTWMRINRAPEARFNWQPEPAFEGDTLTLTNASADPDGDALTALWQISGPGYEAEAFSFDALIAAAATDGHPGDWTVTLTVTDPYGASGQVTHIIRVGDLRLTAEVVHTPRWEQNRQAYNVRRSGDPERPRGIPLFWAGEAFVLKADTNEPASAVTALMSRTGLTTSLAPESGAIRWSGQAFRDDFERLADGEVRFSFTARWPNGHEEKVVCPVYIDGHWSDYYTLVRKQ